jgi:hypothetical protein
MAKNQITTTGQLRNALSEVLSQLRDGEIDADAARLIVKTATAINESLYSEAKIQIVLREAGEVAPKFGRLAIGE